MSLDLSYNPETFKLGQIGRFFATRDLEILRMTLKNNRAPLICPFKLYASFRNHQWISIWVTVRKRTNWVLTFVTLIFDLWLWPSTWTSLLSLVITPENFMMIRWQEHSKKSLTGGRTDLFQYEQTHNMYRRTDGLNHSYSCLVVAKNISFILNSCFNFRKCIDKHPSLVSHA